MRKLLLLLFLGLSSLAHAQTVNFTTEDYRPFNYREGKELKGMTVEQVERIMAKIGVDYTMELMPWVRAYNQALNNPMSCVFATAHDDERDKQFKWVEPLLIDRNILIAREDSNVTAQNLDEAKQYTVGTHREDYTEKLLRKNNFTKIDVGVGFNATFRKLVSGRIDLMPISELYYIKLKRDGEPIRSVAILSEQPMGIACQKDFPDDLLARMQAALNAIIANGEQKAIFAKYGLAPIN
ncbi:MULTISPECIES: substrate-binding periplasmic protein [unclassified Sinorhizobium]|uniref:substrate-binding periplasmic protein n=1 Tax=unclassified Sinorhizobium TaxID=2613772 RepID=UPI0035237919